MIPFIGLLLFLPLQIIPMWDSLNLRTVGAWPYGDLGWHHLVNDSVLYAHSGTGLFVYDIRNPAAPVKLDSATFGAGFNARVGNTLYGAAYGRGVVLCDVSRPEKPSLIGYHLTPDIAYSLCVQDSLLYVAAYGAGLRIINCSDPRRPVELGAWVTPNETYNVAVRGSHAYLADGFGGFRVLDVGDPTNPQELFSHRIERRLAQAVCLADTFALIAWSDSGLRIWNVADPARPREVGRLTGYFHEVAARDSFAFAIAAITTGPGSRDTMLIVSIADPGRPRVVAGHPGGSSLKLWKDLCFVSSPNVSWWWQKEDSLYILDVSNPAQPVLLGACTGFHAHFLTLRVAGSLAFGGTKTQGLKVFDVSSPSEPRLLSRLGNWWVNDVGVTGNLVHLACGHGPFYRVVDASDPHNPALVGTLDSIGFARHLLVRDSLVFVTEERRLRILSAADPGRPRVLASIRSQSDGHACALAGNLLYFADGNAGLRIFDVTDPTRPEPVGQCSTPGWPMDVKVRYPYAYIADGGYGMSVIDVSDPGRPFLAANHPTHYGTFSIDLDGNVAYVADGPWGVRAFDVTVPAEPKPAGFYHTPCFACVVQTAGGLVYVTDMRGWLVLERYPPGITEQRGERGRGALRVRYDPMHRRLSIHLPRPADETIGFCVVSTTGRVVFAGRTPAAKGVAEVQLPRLGAGIYFIRLTTGREALTAKFNVLLADTGGSH